MLESVPPRVDKDHHGLGIDRRIVNEVEQRPRDLGPSQARVLLIETSSTEQYVNTRAFYVALGCTEEARFPDYYGPGDHNVIFCKQLQA